MQDHQIASTWLYGKLQSIGAVTALIGSGATAKAYAAGNVPPNIVPPYLTVGRVSSRVAQAIGSPPSATTLIFDVALWTVDEGGDDTSLVAAMDAIDAALAWCDPELISGKNVSSAVLMDLPPAPPPVNPGEPVPVRLGKSYEIFVGAT